MLAQWDERENCKVKSKKKNKHKLVSQNKYSLVSDGKKKRDERQTPT